MAAINAFSLLDESLFRSINRVPLPEDSTVETQAEEQGEDSNDEEEGTESLESRELLKQIDSHVVELDDNNLRNITVVPNPDAVQPTVTLEPPPTNPLAGQETPASTPLVTNALSAQICFKNLYFIVFFSLFPLAFCQNSMYFLKGVGIRVLNYYSYSKFCSKLMVLINNNFIIILL